MGYKYKPRVKVGTDEHGQAVYRWAVGQTIDELHESIFSLKAHGERKEDQPAPVSFGEYLQNWFSVYKRPKLKPKALSQYECKLKKHILPAFGQKPIAEITVLDIQTFLNERKDYSKSYMRDLMNILGQVFQAAFDDGLITKNPMASRKIFNPATRVEKRTALTDKEVADIIAHIPDLQNQNDRMFMACLMFTGMRPGEIYGLLGPNGAGTTTTLRMLAALVRPDSGDAFVEGVSVTGDAMGVRRRIGFLTSELKLEDTFSPDYLFDFFSSLHHVDPAARDARKRALFERFGIDRFEHTKVADLSTGMKQKVSLAVSVVHDPSVIIFDEPTNGLDVLTAKTVTDFLLELRAQGKTVLLSTHIFSLVEKVCDRVGVVIDGRMAACGTLAEVAGGRSLEDAFFDLYAACAKEA